jgi:vitamin B12/bleomycin/antimicrobial peptide transport system ATP-binding/permease protein
MNSENNVPTHSFISVFMVLSSGFWKGKTAYLAWSLTGAVFAALIAQLLLQIGVNLWNRAFFDALELKSVANVWASLIWLPFIIIGFTLFATALLVSRMAFQARWREWLTSNIAGWWIADQRYYRLTYIAPDQDAPEYRISDDVRLSVEPLVEFAIGLLSAFFTAATFATILWSVAGDAQFSLYGQAIYIPAYMAFFALFYAVIVSVAAYLTGRPLVGLVAVKNESEAHFRAEMTRLRENAESIALIKGDKDELNANRITYATVFNAWNAIIRRQGIISLVLSTNSVLFPIIPLLLITPKYLNGTLSLGAVMQVVAAFSAVQAALIWFVDNLVKLAEWYASAKRVSELAIALEEIDIGMIMEDASHIVLGESEDGAIYLENLSVADRAGVVVINDASTQIVAGEKVMITGESGSGKSTLIRALAGLWPWGAGTIRVPKGVKIAFVPQRPYLPMGSLRDILLYPYGDAKIDDTKIQAAMKRCGLDNFCMRLDEEFDWDRTLSGGERQRVAFCRLLIQQPAIIIMDEATSALDEASQHSMLSLLLDELKPATVISVGHRAGIEEFHDRKISLEKRPAGAQLTSRILPKSLWHLFKGRIWNDEK